MVSISVIALSWLLKTSTATSITLSFGGSRNLSPPPWPGRLGTRPTTRGLKGTLAVLEVLWENLLPKIFWTKPDTAHATRDTTTSTPSPGSDVGLVTSCVDLYPLYALLYISDMTCVVRKSTSLGLKREVHSSLCYNDYLVSIFSSWYFLITQWIYASFDTKHACILQHFN